MTAAAAAAASSVFDDKSRNWEIISLQILVVVIVAT